DWSSDVCSSDLEYRYDKTLDLNVAEKDTDENIESAGKELQAAWDELKEKVGEEFIKNGYKTNDVTYRLFYRMQYQGQLNDLEIEAPIDAFKHVSDFDKLIKTFEETYTRVYAKSALSPEIGYSITGAIVRGDVEVPQPKIQEEKLSDARQPEYAYLEEREINRNGEYLQAKINEMEKLLPGNKISAFSIIESTATTLVVPTGFEAYLDEHRIFHLKELG